MTCDAKQYSRFRFWVSQPIAERGVFGVQLLKHDKDSRSNHRLKVADIGGIEFHSGPSSQYGQH
jgi:hypothetical protein